LADCLKTNTTVTQVHASGNNFGHAGGEAFAKALESNTHLAELVLGSKDGLASIPLKELRDNAIDSLDYSGKKLLEEGGIVLAFALKSNTSVTKVNVASNDLGTEGGKALADCLKTNTTITQVEVSGNALGTAGAKAFGDALLVNKTVQHLNVSDNSLGKMQKGDQVKLKSSGEIKTVTSTYIHPLFSDGIIYVEGKSNHVEPSEFEWESQVPAFCAGLAASTSLLSVHAWSNKMGSDSGKLLADAIKAHTNFEQIAQNMFDGKTKVDMSKQGLDAGDAHIMAAALEKNDTVTQVNVRYNDLDQKTKDLLSKTNKKVKFDV